MAGKNQARLPIDFTFDFDRSAALLPAL